MRARLMELDRQATDIGEISLRRRVEPVTGRTIHEVRLGEEYLMSSLFTEGETELARIGLARLQGRDGLEVAVGGLGLGYTAAAVLDHGGVGAMVVVDALGPVIGWHREGLVPLGERLTGDPRTTLVEGDFFGLVRSSEALDGQPRPRRFDAVLVDIDHSPRHALGSASEGFYTVLGVQQLARHLHPGGVFALWSDDPPDQEYLDVLGAVMRDAEAHVVRFPNPLTGGEGTNTVYVGTAPDVR